MYCKPRVQEMGLEGYELELRHLSLSDSQDHAVPLCLFPRNIFLHILPLSFCQISLLYHVRFLSAQQPPNNQITFVILIPNFHRFDHLILCFISSPPFNQCGCREQGFWYKHLPKPTLVAACR